MKLVKFIVETCGALPFEEYILLLNSPSESSNHSCSKDKITSIDLFRTLYLKDVNVLSALLEELGRGLHCRKRKRKKNITINLYCYGVFQKLLMTSDMYRIAVLNWLCNGPTDGVSNNNVNTVVVHIRLTMPVKHPIDYKTGEMVEEQVVEKRELEHAMSWLSTLGGAFSALGDGIQHCAVVAGKISIKQLQLAVRLGDPHTVIRCKLYCAISLLQLDKFSPAKEIILTQYSLAKQGPVVDPRLISMCRGIWAKYKYDRWRLKNKNGMDV